MHFVSLLSLKVISVILSFIARYDWVSTILVLIMTEYSNSWFSLFKFSLLSILFCLSTISSVIVLIYFYKQQRQLTIYHHFPLMVTILSFVQTVTDMPFLLIYYYRTLVPIQNDDFCLWWNWWDYSSNSVLIFFMAWGCLERHFLVFNATFVRTRLRRIFFHFLPMILTVCYPLLFYLFTIIFNSCENQWDYSAVNSILFRFLLTFRF